MKRAQIGLIENMLMLLLYKSKFIQGANEQTTFEGSFNLSNNVLMHGVQSVTDLMVKPGIINLDFADVETVMAKLGKQMGTGEVEEKEGQ